MIEAELPEYKLQFKDIGYPVATGFYSHVPGATPRIVLDEHLTETERLTALVGLVCFHYCFQHQGGTARFAPFQASF